METHEILCELFRLSGLEKNELIEKSELSKTSVYETLAQDLPWTKQKKPPNRRFDFIQAWVAATRPSDPIKRMEWAALVVKLVLSDEDVDDLLGQKTNIVQIIEQKRPVQSFASHFLPEFFISLFRMRKDN